MKSDDLRSMSDEKLMEAYQMGEALAFDELYGRHSGRVMGYLKQKLSIPKEASDLLQETFFKLHRSRHLYKRRLPFLPWLFTIARSVWMDHLRKTRPEDLTDPFKLSETEKTESVASEILPEANEEDPLLQKLPAGQRAAVSLRVYEEASFEEIAFQLATSPDNARQLVSRGLKKLRTLWREKKD